MAPISRHLRHSFSASIAMLSQNTAFQAPRRPRRHPNPTCAAVTPIVAPLPAYALPPPVLLAVATLSLAALRRVFSKSPNLSLSALVEALRKNFRMILPRRPSRPPPAPLNFPVDHASRLDALRDRSLAEIDALQPAPEDYSSLAPIQRRALLQSALEHAYHSPPPPPTRTKSATPIAVEETKVVKKTPGGVGSKFWNAAEQVNGRLAALGFVLCLAREVAEPGHPSLFEQVVDVVVPIAQKTPPFLVAVVDRLVDLVT